MVCTLGPIMHYIVGFNAIIFSENKLVVMFIDGRCIRLLTSRKHYLTFLIDFMYFV